MLEPSSGRKKNPDSDSGGSGVERTDEKRQGGKGSPEHDLRTREGEKDRGRSGVEAD